MEGSTRIPQRVLVVGGSSEIGSALARLWAARGTRAFVLTERVHGRTDELVEELAEVGASTTAVMLDALRPETIEQAIDDAWSAGDIDVAVLAMGRLEPQNAIEVEPARAREILDVNTVATVQVALEISNRLEHQQHGTLVLLTSVAGQRGRRDNYVYGASKAAVDTLAEGLQQRFAGSGIKVLVVRPGYVHSRMSSGVKPAPFAVTVDESSRRILAAVESGRDSVWIPSMLRPLFFFIRLMPRRTWAAIVSRMR